MSKPKGQKLGKEIDLNTTADKEIDQELRLYRAGKAFAYRLDGMPIDEIANNLEVSPLEVQELVRFAFSKLSVQSADEARAEIEERLNLILRRVNVDLALARTQSERTGLYRIVLAIERDRSTLLGLDIPKGTPDA